MLSLPVVLPVILIFMTSVPVQGLPRRANQGTPAPVVLDGHKLLAAKARVEKRNQAYLAQLGHLTRDADSWLDKGPWTVTDKLNPPENGTINDYLSLGPYWWPTQEKTSENPYGCPYEERDGQRNPDVDVGTDRQDIAAVCASVYSLSLAWYYTEDPKYSQKAATVLRTWFLDPRTRMNPDLEHAQGVHCKYTGRGAGIIDFSQMYTSVIDALAILNLGAPGWSKEDANHMREWNQQFFDWLQHSELGKQEAATMNNHAVFHNMQLAALALSLGNEDVTKELVSNAGGLIDTQIAANGSQPKEAARTRSWHYHNFNLVAFTRLANIASHVGIDLWNYQGPDGQGIRKAIEFILPAALGEAEWPLPELEFSRYAASDVVHAAADAGLVPAKNLAGTLQDPPKGDVWSLRPAAEQLDSVTQL